MPGQGVAHAVAQRVFLRARGAIGPVEARDKARLARHHAAAKLVGRSTDFNAARNFALRQDNRILAHFGKDHGLCRFQTLGCEHFHAHEQITPFWSPVVGDKG